MNEEIFQEVVAIRRDLHQYPEIEFDVERTAKIVAEYLERLGLNVRRNVGKNGVVADLKCPHPTNKTIAFRADMDALPIQEENNEIEYLSKLKGKAHLCGHDAHTAILLGTAKLLATNREALQKNIRFIFQPSEEKSPGGAIGMIQEGCLDGVQEIYGLHVWPWLDVGKIGICPGSMMAQSDGFDISFIGKGGHAAAPHDCIDPIVIGSQFIVMLQTLISRFKSPFDPAVISVTRFEAGSSYNVIPSQANLSGTIRTYNPACLEGIKSNMQRMMENVAAAYGTTGKFNYIEGYPPVINHEDGCHKVAKEAARFLSEKEIVFPAEKAMFGEDFAYYLQKVPGCFIQLGCRNESKNCVYALHHPKFNLDEECMKTGMSLFETLALSTS